MSDHPAAMIMVYCDGPSDNPHERYDIIRYVRLVDDGFPDGRDWVPAHRWADADGRIRRAREHVAHKKRSRHNPKLQAAGIPPVRFQYYFRCPRCGFDEQRNDGSGLADVFDRRAANGDHEIPVRELIRLAWPPRV